MKTLMKLAFLIFIVGIVSAGCTYVGFVIGEGTEIANEGIKIGLNANIFARDQSLDNDLFVLVNSHRKDIGAVQLNSSPFLCDLALARVTEVKSDFSHDKFTSRMKDETYSRYINKTLLGENIARDKTADLMFTAWLNSPTHKENVENKSYKYGCVRCINTYNESKTCVLITSN